MMAQIQEDTVSEGIDGALVSGEEEPTEASKMQDLNEDDLMFGGMERVIAPPPLPDNEAEVSLKLKMVHEVEMYVQSSIMHLRGDDSEFLDLLHWWE